jgi:hypothetical protein
MKRYVVPAIELCGFIAAIYFGVQWYLNLQGNNEAAFALSGVVAALAEWFRRHLRTGVAAQEISAFIEQGQRLMSRKQEDPLPIGEHNAWVEEMETYFRKFGRADYVVRLSDFSGLTFYCDGSEKSKYSKALDGRLRRLHEFLRELAVEAK